MTRSRTARGLTVTAVLALAVAGAPGLAGEPEKGTVGVGQIATGNVEHVATVPLDTDIAGGRVVDGDFFVRTAKGITIYDTSDPERPVPKGFVAVPATPNQEREDIDTNGRVLVTGQSYDGNLWVVDVEDRTAPRVLSRLAGAADHTNTCVLDCRFVYGSSGTIVDLTDPAAPKELPQRWTTLTGVSSSHDLTEVQPGLLLAASNPVALIDATVPSAPVKVTTGRLADGRYMHGTSWPRGGTDRFALAGSETGLGCQGELGSFVVFDTEEHQESAAEGFAAPLRRTGEYQVQRGLPTEMEGEAPAAQHCGHWFDAHPDFEDGGLVAMAWYTSGVRFLDVTADGAVEERGFWQPLPGQSSAVYWITDELLYVTDYTARGFDVLRFDRDAAPERDAAAPGSFLRAGSAEEARAQAADAAALARLDAAGLRREHHGPLADLAAAWMCQPDGSMPTVGVPAPAVRALLP